MTESFFARLERRAREAGSVLCVGLDPRAETAEAAQSECLRLIEATAEAACAFKVNSAFFERHGAEGFAALRQVIARVPPEIPVILDAKRGDIAETSEAYAQAAFDTLGAHAITISPYLGRDAIAPFLARPDRGAFVLCKTSNAGADELQALEVGGRPLYEVVAERAQSWSSDGNLGLVVGATDPAALARVRAVAPDLWFLVPGVGAQGGGLEQALKAGLRKDGLGLLITVSRSIAAAPNPRREAERICDEISAIKAKGVRPQTQISKAVDASVWVAGAGNDGQPPEAIVELAQGLLESNCIRFGKFTLHSGKLSPIYLDLRNLISHPATLKRVAEAYAARLDGLTFDRLAAIPYAALPIATALSLQTSRPMIYPRREAKNYGTQVEIEGAFEPGETALVIDDLATTGGSKIEAIRKLESAGLVVRDVLVLIDREQGAREMLEADGYRLHSIVTLRALLLEWRRSRHITDPLYTDVLAYLSGKLAR